MKRRKDKKRGIIRHYNSRNIYQAAVNANHWTELSNQQWVNGVSRECRWMTTQLDNFNLNRATAQQVT